MDPVNRTHAIWAVATTAVVTLLILIGGLPMQRWQIYAGAVVTEGMLILIPTLVVAHRHGGLAALFARGALRWRDLPLIVGLALGFFLAALVAAVVVAVALRFAGADLSAPDVLYRLLGSGSAGEVGLVLLIAVGLAPVCEEALFRGLLQPALRRVMPAPGALAITAVAFGLFHLHPLRFAPTAVIGVGAGLVRDKYQSIWASVVFHATCNAAGVALAVLLLRVRTGQ